jgi:hypothetical protein
MAESWFLTWPETLAIIALFTTQKTQDGGRIGMLGQGFEPWSSARKAKMIGRTTPTERTLAFRVLGFNPIETDAT